MEKNKKSIGIVCSDIYMRFSEIMEEEFDDLLEFLEDEHIRCEGATDVFMGLQKENKKLKDNWNKLKEWVRKDNNCFETLFYMGRCVNFQCILDKMQELEQGSDK